MNGRMATATMACAAVALIGLTAAWTHGPMLVWNASGSVPIGLYAVQGAAPLRVDELVIAQPTGPLADFLAAGGYLPKGVPLIKHIAGLPGSIVCRHGTAISIDGIVRVQARERDHAGRLLPAWSGCRTVTPTEVLLLNVLEPASLDGRYFGPLPSSSIVGRAVPIWTEGKP